MCVFTITGELFDLGPIMATPIIRQLVPKIPAGNGVATRASGLCPVGTIGGSAVCSLIAVFGEQLRARDGVTARHQERVCELSVALARELGMSDHEIAGVAVAAILHDIGKALLPPEMLHKPGRLTPRETALMRAHPETGAELLRDLPFPWPVRETIRQHHERHDGTGYPHGLSGSSILPAARVIAVADVVEAMASDRPHRSALPLACVAEHIASSDSYDPAVARACTMLYERGALGSYVRSPRLAG